MRSIIFVIASASARDRMTRSSVWQCVQFLIEAFCCSVPGRLRNQSALESCAAGSAVLRSFRSAMVLPAPTSIELGLTRSYPTARMRNAYWPGGSFGDGNRYRPCSSLTTVTVMVEPAFLAPMRTPSIGPSSAEPTRPVRANEGGVSARPRAAWKQHDNTPITGNKTRTFIGPPFERSDPERYYANTKA